MQNVLHIEKEITPKFIDEIPNSHSRFNITGEEPLLRNDIDLLNLIHLMAYIHLLDVAILRCTTFLVSLEVKTRSRI